MLEEVAPCPPTAKERIAYALAPESRDYYLPLFHSANFDIPRPSWIDTTREDHDGWEKTLFDLDPTILVTGWGTPAIPDRFARSADLSLRYVCHLAGTVKPLVPRHLIERGVLVSNWGASISYIVAEHALLLVLGALRNLRGWDSFFRKWPSTMTPFTGVMLKTKSLRGQRVGLHGFGAIAHELVQMLKGLQVEVSSYSHGVPKHLFQQAQVHCCGSLEELFSTSDIIIECEALTPQSKGSVTADLLRLLPEDAVFVNVGRGQVVEEEALVKLASEGRLRLGLDVYQHEPLPLNSPLFKIPHALLSPPLAGPTEDGFPLLAEFAVHNIRRYLSNSDVEGRVTLEAYDRST
jgi:phosphoglycerate dehydrogenase-like enzyme